MAKSLQKADPTGRLDVLLFKMLDRLAEQAEKKYGLAGLSADLRPITERLVRKVVPMNKPIPQTILRMAQDVLQNAQPR